MTAQLAPPPVEVWPLAYYLAEEMEARGWRATDVAARMPGDCGRNIIMVNLLLSVQDEKMLLDAQIMSALGDAFDVSADLFKNLHNNWLQWPAARQAFECPEHLLNGLLIPCNDKS